MKFISTTLDEHPGAHRYRTKFVNPIFQRATVINTEFSGITLEGPTFKDAELQNVRFNINKFGATDEKPVMVDADFTYSGSRFASGCKKELEFQVIFQGNTKFTNSKFEIIDFKDSEFTGDADFRGTTFEVKACFELTKFPQGANFDYSTFDSGLLPQSESCEVSFPTGFPLNSSGLPKGSNWSGPDKYWRPVT